VPTTTYSSRPSSWPSCPDLGRRPPSAVPTSAASTSAAVRPDLRPRPPLGAALLRPPTGLPAAARPDRSPPSCSSELDRPAAASLVLPGLVDRPPPSALWSLDSVPPGSATLATESSPRPALAKSPSRAKSPSSSPARGWPPLTRACVCRRSAQGRSSSARDRERLLTFCAIQI
jgi:hypothetical protein